MQELINHIWKLRNSEDMPLHFRRRWTDYTKKPVWYIWYGYTSIAYGVDIDKAWIAVEAAATVHRSFSEKKLKAA